MAVAQGRPKATAKSAQDPWPQEQVRAAYARGTPVAGPRVEGLA